MCGSAAGPTRRTGQDHLESGLVVEGDIWMVNQMPRLVNLLICLRRARWAQSVRDDLPVCCLGLQQQQWEILLITHSLDSKRINLYLPILRFHCLNPVGLQVLCLPTLDLLVLAVPHQTPVQDLLAHQQDVTVWLRACAVMRTYISCTPPNIQYTSRTCWQSLRPKFAPAGLSVTVVPIMPHEATRAGPVRISPTDCMI